MIDGPPAIEAWLRGPVDGIPTQLQPVAHSLVQAREDLERLLAGVSGRELHARPGGAASIAFHVLHAAGALDRLLTYARGEPLADAQRAALRAERDPPPDLTDATALEGFRAGVARALDQLRDTSEATLDEPRAVGRAGLPSSVRGLLFHAAEHTTRHVGQVSTTLKVLRGI